MCPGEVRGVARKFAVFVALRNAGCRQQSFRTRLQTAVTAGDSPVRTAADCFPTRPFAQRTTLDRGLHTEVTVLTVHPGSEFVQGQKLLGLCTSCGVEEGAVETGGKNGTKSSARRASHINRHLITRNRRNRPTLAAISTGSVPSALPLPRCTTVFFSESSSSRTKKIVGSPCFAVRTLLRRAACKKYAPPPSYSQLTTPEVGGE
jgi:hypothetical protein